MRGRGNIRAERGQTMVEFAMVLPILCLLLFGVIQFGITFNNYVTLTDAVRAASRKAAVSRQSGTRDADIQNALYDSAADLDKSKLPPPTVTSTWQHGDPVTVCATYPYDINLLGMVVASGNLKSCTKERVE
jgi:Flp pilus assembly protein TadG